MRDTSTSPRKTIKLYNTKTGQGFDWGYKRVLPRNESIIKTESELAPKSVAPEENPSLKEAPNAESAPEPEQAPTATQKPQTDATHQQNGADAEPAIVPKKSVPVTDSSFAEPIGVESAKMPKVEKPVSTSPKDSFFKRLQARLLGKVAPHVNPEKQIKPNFSSIESVFGQPKSTLFGWTTYKINPDQFDLLKNVTLPEGTRYRTRGNQIVLEVPTKQLSGFKINTQVPGKLRKGVDAAEITENTNPNIFQNKTFIPEDLLKKKKTSVKPVNEKVMAEKKSPLDADGTQAKVEPKATVASNTHQQSTSNVTNITNNTVHKGFGWKTLLGTLITGGGLGGYGVYRLTEPNQSANDVPAAPPEPDPEPDPLPKQNFLSQWMTNVSPEMFNNLKVKDYPVGHSLFGALAGGAIGAGIGGLNYISEDDTELSEEEKKKRSLAKAMLSSAGIGAGIGGLVGGVSDVARSYEA